MYVRSTTDFKLRNRFQIKKPITIACILTHAYSKLFLTKNKEIWLAENINYCHCCNASILRIQKNTIR